MDRSHRKSSRRHPSPLPSSRARRSQSRTPALPPRAKPGRPLRRAVASASDQSDVSRHDKNEKKNVRKRSERKPKRLTDAAMIRAVEGDNAHVLPTGKSASEIAEAAGVKKDGVVESVPSVSRPKDFVRNKVRLPEMNHAAEEVIVDAFTSGFAIISFVTKEDLETYISEKEDPSPADQIRQQKFDLVKRRMGLQRQMRIYSAGKEGSDLDVEDNRQNLAMGDESRSTGTPERTLRPPEERKRKRKAAVSVRCASETSDGSAVEVNGKEKSAGILKMDEGLEANALKIGSPLSGKDSEKASALLAAVKKATTARDKQRSGSTSSSSGTPTRPSKNSGSGTDVYDFESDDSSGKIKPHRDHPLADERENHKTATGNEPEKHTSHTGPEGERDVLQISHSNTQQDGAQMPLIPVAAAVEKTEAADVEKRDNVEPGINAGKKSRIDSAGASCEEPETTLVPGSHYPSKSSPPNLAESSSSNGKKPEISTTSSTSPSCSQEPSRAVADSSQKPQSSSEIAGSTTASDRPVSPSAGKRSSRERDRESDRDRQHRKEKHREREREREHHKDKKSSRDRDRDREERDKNRDKKSSGDNSHATPIKSGSDSHHSPAVSSAPSSTPSSLPPRNPAIFNPGLHSLSPNPPNPLTPHLFHSPPTPLSPSFPSHLPSSVASPGSFLGGSPFNSRWGMLSSFMGLPPGPMGMGMMGGSMGAGPMSLLGPGFDRSTGSFFGFPLPTSMGHGPGSGPGPGAFAGAGHSYLNTSMASSLPSFSPNMPGMNMPGLSGAMPGFPHPGLPPSLGSPPSAAAAAAAAASLAGMPGMSMQPGGQPVKKPGKWCAMHVRLAWEIYQHQQRQQASNQNAAEALRLGDIISLTGSNREFSLTGGRGPLPPSSASLPLPAGLSSNFLTRPTGLSGPSQSDLAASLMQGSPRMPSSWAMRPPYGFSLPPNFGLPFQNPLLSGRDILSSSLSPGSSSLPGPDSWRRPMAFGGLANPNQLNGPQNPAKEEKPPEKKPDEKEFPKEKREDSENRENREKRKRTDSSTRSSPAPPVKKEREKDSPEITRADTPKKPDSKAIDLRNRSESVPGGTISIPERTKSVNAGIPGIPSFPGNDFMGASLFPSMPGGPFPPNFWPGQPTTAQEIYWRSRPPMPPASVPGSDLYARLNSQHNPYLSERDRLDFLRMRTGNYPGIFGPPPNFGPNFMRPFDGSPFYGQNPSAPPPSLAAAAALSGADKRISSPVGKREVVTLNGSDKDSPTDLSKSRSSGKDSSGKSSSSSSKGSSSSSSHKEKEREKDKERMSTSSTEKEKS